MKTITTLEERQHAETMLQNAIAYVTNLNAVVPVGAWSFTGKDGREVSMWKRPLISNWTVKPLNTVQAVTAFWKKQWYDWFQVPGIGIATGQICGGYIVIDLDVKPEKGIDGREVLRDWEHDTGMRLPEETWTAITGSGGYHLWFHSDRALRSYQNATLGVDLRADGGQVIVPPSLHPNGRRYEWEIWPRDCPCAEADEAVYSFIEYCKPSGSQYVPSVRRGEGGERKMILPPEIPEGGRHDPLISLIGTMNKLGVSDEAIEAAVRIENEQKCKPPFDEDELQHEILPAIYRWDKGVNEEAWKTKDEWRAMYKQQMRAKRAIRSL